MAAGIRPAAVVIERRWDGTIHAKSPYPLRPYPERLTERLEHWALVAPDRTFM